MIISEQWLRDWVRLDLSTSEIADELTNAGLEVDGVEPVAGKIDHLVVGKVLEVNKHPDADRLNLTRIDVGDAELDIVCGASNVSADLLVAVALIGAKLPNGMKIKKAKVRGAESNGMLCSAAELGLAEQSDGILELDQDADIGQRVDEYLQLDDQLIDVDLTPNRGDCLSVQGIARELKVLTGGEMHPLDITEVPAETDHQVGITLSEPAHCPRYLGRLIGGVNPQASTPMWMCERLRRSGVRPISPVVDITNYVMLELGQPMHAFDHAKLQGDIVVRKADAGETIKLLDDSTATLNADSLLITDASGPIAIAGVMGGLDSAIDDQTDTIVLEAAHFTRKAVAGTARGYGLHTESSHRFERGVDPLLPAIAIQRATELIIEICGGSPGPVCTAEAHKDILAVVDSKADVSVRLSRLQQLLGMQLDSDEVADILSRISAGTRAVEGGWMVTPPSYRFDVECEADLVEEVARVKGYDNIPTAIPRIAPRSIVGSEQQVSARSVRQTLVARDLNEVITYSFIDPQAQQMLDREKPVQLSNPLAENMSVMRTSLLPGLLATLQFNRNRQHERLRLFEIGATYHQRNAQDAGEKSASPFREVQRLACAMTGPRLATQWSGGKPQNVDFYDIKAEMQAVLGLTGKKEPFIFNEFEHIAMHPGQVCSVCYGKIELGFLGQLHPSLQKHYGFSSEVFVFEVDLEQALQADLPAFREVSKFPSVNRDLSIVVERSVAVASMCDAVKAGLGDALKEVVVFDVYQGEGIQPDHQSVSLSLLLQSVDRTMTDDEAQALSQQALEILTSQFGAELRS